MNDNDLENDVSTYVLVLLTIIYLLVLDCL